MFHPHSLLTLSTIDHVHLFPHRPSPSHKLTTLSTGSTGAVSLTDRLDLVRVQGITKEKMVWNVIASTSTTLRTRSGTANQNFRLSREKRPVLF